MSKLWGCADLPHGCRYPEVEWVNEDGMTCADPMTFVCQIRLQDIAAYDSENLLPHTGMLYFFADIDYFLGNLEADSPGMGQGQVPRSVCSRNRAPGYAQDSVRGRDCLWTARPRTVFRPLRRACRWLQTAWQTVFRGDRRGIPTLSFAPTTGLQRRLAPAVLRLRNAQLPHHTRRFGCTQMGASHLPPAFLLISEQSHKIYSRRKECQPGSPSASEEVRSDGNSTIRKARHAMWRAFLYYIPYYICLLRG